MTTRGALRLVYVIPCAASKVTHPVPAGELYDSPHFRFTLGKVTAAAARDGAGVLILSALHGLVRPDRVLAPYEQRMTPARATEIVPTLVGQLRDLEVGALVSFLPAAYAAALQTAAAAVGVLVRDVFAGSPRPGIGTQRGILAAFAS